MKVLIVAIILAVVLGVSIFVNFYLIQNNLEIQKRIDHFESKNHELSNEIHVLVSKIDILEEKVSETTIETKLKSKTETKTESESQSINAVGVRPVLLRNGFFEQVQYEGTILNIELSIRGGSGLVLVNTEIPTGVDFQSSAKIAVEVAEKYLNTDLADRDIIFSITSDENENLQAVDGYSAGAAMTTLLISHLQHKNVKDSIIMTGAINPDMSIGSVGGIFEKAQAAGQNDAEIFLVPKFQAITHVESCEESKTGTFIYRSCTLEEKPLSPITEEMFGMKTIEIGDIGDALLYFQ